MGRADRLEGFIADGTARRGVGGRARTKNDAHRLLPSDSQSDRMNIPTAIDDHKESAPWMRGGFIVGGFK
jgi:hypothetical protein